MIHGAKIVRIFIEKFLLDVSSRYLKCVGCFYLRKNLLHTLTIGKMKEFVLLNVKYRKRYIMAVTCSSPDELSTAKKSGFSFLFFLSLNNNTVLFK